jgi:hypothetical protein
MSECLTDTVDLLADRQDGNVALATGKMVGSPVAPHADLDLAGLTQALNAAVNAITAAGEVLPKALIDRTTAIIRHYSRPVPGLLRQSDGQNEQAMRLIEGFLDAAPVRGLPADYDLSRQ